MLNDPMDRRFQAIERTEQLAMEGHSPSRIRRILRKEGLEEQLVAGEIERIIARLDTLRRLIPRRPGRLLPRVIGVVAVLMGAGAIILGFQGGIGAPGRRNPAAFGAVALVLGIILIVKPGSSRDEL